MITLHVGVGQLRAPWPRSQKRPSRLRIFLMPFNTSFRARCGGVCAYYISLPWRAWSVYQAIYVDIYLGCDGAPPQWFPLIAAVCACPASSREVCEKIDRGPVATDHWMDRATCRRTSDTEVGGQLKKQEGGQNSHSQFRSCVRVEVDVLGCPS